MSDLKQCDGCDAISPRDGLYHANKWVVITVDPVSERNIYTKTKRTYHLCEKCFGVELKPVEPWMEKLLANREIRSWVSWWRGREVESDSSLTQPANSR